MKGTRSATLAILAAGICWGMVSYFVKQLANFGLLSPQIVFLRAFLASLFFGGILAVSQPEALKIRLADVWMFFGTGVISQFCFNCFYFYTMTHGHAAVGGVLLYSSPAFILILSALLFHERITGLKALAVFLTICGCVLVSGLCEQSQTAIPPRILCYGLMAGFLYSLYTIFGKYALKKYAASTVTFYTFLFAASAGFLFAHGPRTLWLCVTTPMVLFWGSMAALLFTLLPYFLYTWGLRVIPPGRASIIVSVEPIVCCIMGLCFYHEPSSLLRFVGIASILLAIVLLNIQHE